MNRTGIILRSKELLAVVEEDLKIKWNGRENNKTFRCKPCGHRFKLGDKFIYLIAGKYKTRNFFACDKCFCMGHDVTCQVMAKLEEESKIKYWWLWEDLGSGREDAQTERCEAGQEIRDLQLDIKHLRYKHDRY